MQWHLPLGHIQSQPNPESIKLNLTAKEQAPLSWSLSTDQVYSSSSSFDAGPRAKEVSIP